MNALGAYVSGQNLNTAQIVDKEAAFGQDLNGDTQIGIVTTMLTAFALTQFIVAVWVKYCRPKEVPL